MLEANSGFGPSGRVRGNLRDARGITARGGGRITGWPRRSPHSTGAIKQSGEEGTMNDDWNNCLGRRVGEKNFPSSVYLSSSPAFLF